MTGRHVKEKHQRDEQPPDAVPADMPADEAAYVDPFAAAEAPPEDTHRTE
jgi:hypothetical protein